MKKIFSLFLMSVGVTAVTSAQDPNFSQFFASPLTLNPALTGKFDGTFRVAGNFRNQWPTINNAFVTKTASVSKSREIKPGFPKGSVKLWSTFWKSQNLKVKSRTKKLLTFDLQF